MVVVMLVMLISCRFARISFRRFRVGCLRTN